MPLTNKKWNEFISKDKRPPAGIVICFDDKDRVLILRRSKIDKRAGQWTIPGGHIDAADDSIEAGAARELKEETDLTCDPAKLIYIGEPRTEKFYFLAPFWDGNVNVSIPNPETGEIEHDAYRWASIDDIKDIEDTEIPIYLLEKALDMLKNAK